MFGLLDLGVQQECLGYLMSCFLFPPSYMRPVVLQDPQLSLQIDRVEKNIMKLVFASHLGFTALLRLALRLSYLTCPLQSVRGRNSDSSHLQPGPIETRFAQSTSNNEQ